MLIRSSWRVVAVLIVVATILVTAVTIGVLTSDSDTTTDVRGGDTRDSSEATTASLRQALVLDSNPLVVTDLRVVVAATDDAARDQCSAFTTDKAFASAEWIVVGRNLNTATTATSGASSSNASFVYLCVQRARVGDVQTNGTNATATASINTTTTVLQSLRVLSTTECPSPLTTLYRPRPDVVLCTQTTNASVALATGTYVSDITVSMVGFFYYSVAPGWMTEATSVAMPDPSTTTNPVYVSYRRPVRPIVAATVLLDVAASDTAIACAEQLGATWEQAGYDGIRSDTAPGSNATQTILCLERALLNATQLANASTVLPAMLVGIAVVATTTTNCSEDYSARLELTAEWTLCLKYESSESAERFIDDLRLQQLAPNALLPAETLGEETSSETRVHVVSTSTSSPVVVLRYRYHAATVVTSPTTVPTSETALPPLRARDMLASNRGRKLRAEANDTDGLTFKIVQLADLHYTGDASHECRNPPKEMLDRGEICTEAATTAFVEQVLDAEKPDFVVFTGDNVEVLNGQSLADALAAAVGPVEKRKIPYAWVFGNHDDENGQTRADMAQRLIGRPLSYMQWGPRALSGVGNYELSVEAPRDGPWGVAGSKVFQMYLLDSHAYADTQTYPGVKSTYDWIKPDQVAYYKELATANRLPSANASVSTPIPAVMFFHIPIPEYASVDSATTSPSAATSTARPGDRSGEMNEMVMSSEINSNLFSALVEMGDVKATFVGHDHTNDYCVLRQGVQLCFGGGAGFAQAYGSASFARRSRVIEWHADGVSNKKRITSWKRHYGSAFGTRQHEETLFEEV